MSGEDNSNSSPSVGDSTNTLKSQNTTSRVLRRNARGNRSDIAWKHEVAVDGTRKIQCKYCQKVVTGGTYRLKHHLAGTNKDVEPCIASNSFLSEEEQPKVGEKRKGVENLFRRKGISTQATINNMFKKGIKEEANQAIARCFYNNAIPFNVARSDEYFEMFELVAKHGPGVKPPSYHEIKVKYLKEEVKLTNARLEEHKAEWKKVGCTIMTDGWTDKRGMTILNFLVHSPKGIVFLKSIDASHIAKTADRIFKMIYDVVEEIGEDNVVQVVTDNASNFKVAGEMLMEKRKKLYWTPCVAHCIDLILEEFEKKIPIHADTIYKGRKITTFIYGRTSLISLLQQHTKVRDLVRPGLTRFATSYLTLGCLNENRTSLIRMFTSAEWKATKFVRTHDGRLVEDVVLDKEFWKNVVFVLKGTFLLMKVLHLVDSDDYEKPPMGLIYEATDQAKEKIQSIYNGVEDR
ncbi:PREDICTED: uncharacterized protein LOC109327663 [Lupinus angustifolius]|uniref:uncharacterized protein LOC109327663 n=1 Tax=Lupinus angustifolius TaxID=3871 RepID=UPI00092FC4E3|nr:PREDICTED: uncharacterized protein LOC109327663 [Lupinus angustifolius]